VNSLKLVRKINNKSQTKLIFRFIDKPECKQVFFVLPKNIFTNPTQNLSFSLKPAFESSASHVPPTTRLRFINNSDLFLEG
jgi:hypothetical protein